MYKNLTLLFAGLLLLAACSVKEKSLEKVSESNNVDITSTAFKRHLSDSLFSFSNFKFTKFEFEYPDSVAADQPGTHPQTRQEPGQASRLKSILKGEINSNSGQVKKDFEESAKLEFKSEASRDSLSRTKDVKPASGYAAFNLIAIVFVASVLFLAYAIYTERKKKKLLVNIEHLVTQIHAGDNYDDAEKRVTELLLKVVKKTEASL